MYDALVVFMCVYGCNSSILWYQVHYYNKLKFDPDYGSAVMIFTYLVIKLFCHDTAIM